MFEKGYFQNKNSEIKYLNFKLKEKKYNKFLNDYSSKEEIELTKINLELGRDNYYILKSSVINEEFKIFGDLNIQFIKFYEDSCCIICVSNMLDIYIDKDIPKNSETFANLNIYLKGKIEQYKNSEKESKNLLNEIRGYCKNKLKENKDFCIKTLE